MITDTRFESLVKVLGNDEVFILPAVCLRELPIERRGVGREAEFISTKCGLESNKCAKYLSALMSLGLVSKEHPYGEKASKKSIYKLEDFMFRFWYRFVFPNMSAIIAGLGEAVYDHEIDRQLNAYMGLIFEEICKQWLFEMAKRDALPFFVGSLGRWWGSNSATRKQEEIDIVATRRDDALFAECKWTNANVDTVVYDELRQRSGMFHYGNRHLYIFAKKAFSERLLKLAYEERAVSLFCLPEMIETLEGGQG